MITLVYIIVNDLSVSIAIAINSVGIGNWNANITTVVIGDVIVKALTGELMEITVHKDITLHVSRSHGNAIGYYLGIYVVHSDGLSAGAKGVIGMYDLCTNTLNKQTTN